MAKVENRGWQVRRIALVLRNWMLMSMHLRKVLFEPELLRLSTAMTAQSVVKHFLTEGDRLIVSKFSPLKDQGGYAVATNYGMLYSRLFVKCDD